MHIEGLFLTGAPLFYRQTPILSHRGQAYMLSLSGLLSISIFLDWHIYKV